MCRTWMSLLTGVALAGFAFAETGGSSDKLGTKITPDFVDTTGKAAPIANLVGEQATVVLFLSFDCPNSNGYTPTLLDLHRAYSDKGVKFVAVCESELTADELKAKVAEYKLPFPVFPDPKEATADTFKAKYTPEAFVLDHNQVLRYRGR
ncbi:MAG: redoxin domain-containing protein, partial [Zavarzinella sp.]|nr:redoxin domain-containing protein [Zavarzinella sp.]